MELFTLENIKQDGRFKRSARSRQGIIDAMIALMEQGEYIPTAQQVADQANISLRTVFRHFTEMEQLYKEVNDAVRPSYEKYYVNHDIAGSLDERIARLVKNRLIGHENTYHLCRATHALMWRYDVLRETYYKNQKKLRSLLIEMLPELKEKDADILELADAIMSFEAFDRYHTIQNLTVEDCNRLFSEQLKRLLS